MKLLPYAGAVVSWPLYALTPDVQGRLKRALTFQLPTPYLSRGLTTDSPVVTAYSEKEGYLLLPRHLPWEEFGLAPPIRRFLARQCTRPVTVHFIGTLRDSQHEAAQALYTRLAQAEDGILSLSCGKGKTVLALAAWCQAKRPGLAIVPTLQIADQWVQRLKEFTDVSDEQIGRVGGGRNEGDRDFVVATIQTVAQKQFGRDFYRRFGVVFFDECHRLGAPGFSITGGLFPGVRIGLSATWRRADGLESLFRLHLGNVFYEDHGQELIPEVYFVRTAVTLDLAKFRLWGRKGDVNFAKVVTTLARNEERQQQVLTLIEEAVSVDRKVLVLGDRKEELAMYADALSGRNIDCGLCVGSLDGWVLPQQDRNRALERRVVLATSQLVKEGLDQKDIDTLIILYPKSNQAFAEQAAGRILRTHTGKAQPIIIVLVDDGCTKRRTVYDELGVSHTVIDHPFTLQCTAMERHFRKLGYRIVRTAA